MMRSACYVGLLMVIICAHAPLAEARPLPTVASSLAEAQLMFPDGVCSGVPNDTRGRPLMRVTYMRDLLEKHDMLGFSTGRAFDVDGGPYSEFYGCVLTVDPDLPPAVMCDTIVHEFGHVSANLRHTHNGSVMDGEGARLAWCHERTRRESAQDLVRLHLMPGRTWRVSCDRRVHRCRARSRGARPRTYTIDRSQRTAIFDGYDGPHGTFASAG